MKRKTYLRYSEGFKLAVVRQIEKEGLGLPSACKRFGVGSQLTIRRWLRKYGHPSLLKTKIIIMKAKEQTKEQEQAKRIKELEQALVATQLKHLEAEAFLELACERLGEDRESFKKKVDQQASKKQSD